MSEDAESFAGRAATDRRQYPDAEATIILEGELDVRSVERFLARVREALEAHPGPIAVDAHGVTFMDSSGLAASLHARSMSGHAGVSFRIGDVSPKVGRVVEVAGVEELLTESRWREAVPRLGARGIVARWWRPKHSAARRRPGGD